jgi:hypothetical protein
MALDLWFREDVQRILTALASAAGEAHGPQYLKALADVALAFGVAAPTDGSRHRPRIEVLDLVPVSGERGWGPIEDWRP